MLLEKDENPEVLEDEGEPQKLNNPRSWGSQKARLSQIAQRNYERMMKERNDSLRADS